MPDTFWRGRRVLVTGHTGFIGSWLCLALHREGATVAGVALDPPTQPNLFEAARVGSLIARDERCDIRDAAVIAEAVRQSEPEVVFHLAAQPLVRLGYATPIETYATNIMGTVHVLDALRSLRGIAAAVVMTSDKCYANDDSGRPLNERDALGGYDPYSSSKACAEIVTASYRDSYLREGGVPLATVRAGNVIGGGDWAADRLLPDVVRAFAAGRPVSIRHPAATRPWQHVLDPVAGCMILAQALASHGNEYAEPWNFGPNDAGRKTVSYLATLAAQIWGGGAMVGKDGEGHAHEAHLLSLDTSKAQSRLGWQTRWQVERAVLESLNWYKAHLNGEDMQLYTLAQIDSFSEGGSYG
jgi:CDP-glucose 4,6-dehydratase